MKVYNVFIKTKYGHTRKPEDENKIYGGTFSTADKAREVCERENKRCDKALFFDFIACEVDEDFYNWFN